MGILHKHRVLVLNKSWTPIGVVGLKKAMNLVTKKDSTGFPIAKILDVKKDFSLFEWHDWEKLIAEDNDLVIRSSHKAYKAPEIILLNSYNKIPQRKASFSRKVIYRRDNYSCQYCGVQPGTKNLTIDHVVPRSLGGKTTWENCVLACVSCNSRKANKNLENTKMKLLKKPIMPKFLIISKNEYRCESWQQVLSAAYWEVELENDN